YRANLGPQNLAIKVLRQEVTGGKDFRADFMGHAQALTSPSLKHPCIVDTYHFGDENGLFYVVSELVTGGPLNTAEIAGSSVEERNAAFLEGVNFIKQIADALTVAQSQKLVHGNIKPTNILVSEPVPGHDSVAKLADIGLARLVTEVRRSDAVV